MMPLGCTTSITSEESRHIRSRSAVRLATRCSRVRLRLRSACSARRRSLTSRRMAVVKAWESLLPVGSRHLHEAGRTVAAEHREFDRAGQPAARREGAPGIAPGRLVAKQHGNRMIDQLGGGVAEFLDRGRVGELDQAVDIERQNRVGGRIDDGVVAGVLALAQQPVAFGDDGDVENLQQAARRTPAEGPHGDIMEEFFAGPGFQIEQLPVQGVGEHAGGAGGQRVGNHRLQALVWRLRKKFRQAAMQRVTWRYAAGGRHPMVPGGNPGFAIQYDQANIDDVEKRREIGKFREHRIHATCRPPARSIYPTGFPEWSMRVSPSIRRYIR